MSMIHDLGIIKPSPLPTIIIKIIKQSHVPTSYRHLEVGKQVVVARSEIRSLRRVVKQLPVEMLQQCTGCQHSMHFVLAELKRHGSGTRNVQVSGLFGDVKQRCGKEQSDFIAAVLMEEYETWNNGDFVFTSFVTADLFGASCNC
jgi:hypothetical protein